MSQLPMLNLRKKNFNLYSLLRVNLFVESTKQAFVPMRSSLSLTTLSNIPPPPPEKPFGSKFPIRGRCYPNARQMLEGRVDEWS